MTLGPSTFLSLAKDRAIRLLQYLSELHVLIHPPRTHPRDLWDYGKDALFFLEDLKGYKEFSGLLLDPDPASRRNKRQNGWRRRGSWSCGPRNHRIRSLQRKFSTGWTGRAKAQQALQDLRKRDSVAIERLSCPDTLPLGKPTSGFCARTGNPGAFSTDGSKSLPRSI